MTIIIKRIKRCNKLNKNDKRLDFKKNKCNSEKTALICENRNDE